jgi:hypothetical protein
MKNKCFTLLFGSALLYAMCFVFLPSANIFAQETKPVIPSTTQPLYSIMPSTDSSEAVLPVNHIPQLHLPPSEMLIPPVKIRKNNPFYPRYQLDSIKQVRYQEMMADSSWRSSSNLSHTPQSVEVTQLQAPVLGQNFQGNLDNGAYPPDNAIAISSSGWIVSVVNSSISFYRDNGQVFVNSQALSTYFSFLNIPNAFFFDPRVLFDPVANRFILVCLHGSTVSTSRLIVSFSQSDDPTAGWYTYNYSGNIAGISGWFDYPHIGISANDLYITGNLYNNGGTFLEAVVLQFRKSTGYTGQNLPYGHWRNIMGADNIPAASLKPVSHGYGTGYGPGIYLVSSKPFAGSNIQLFDITQDYGNNPQLQPYSIPCTAYSIGADALQLGSSKTLNVNDCRILDAFFASGKIHYVHHNTFQSGFNGIRYGILDIASSTTTSNTYGLVGSAYSFPCIAPFDASPSATPTVAIGFTRSSSGIYPEARATTVTPGFNFSSSITIKAGQSPITIQTGNEQRWGDYSGISRKHSSATPSVWMFACYGQNTTYGNWIAEIVPQGSGGGSPNATCATATTITCGQTLTGTTSGSAQQVAACDITLNTAPGLWYRYTASQTGQVTATTCNSGTTFDTKIGVFSGSCSNLVCLAGNDDSSDAGCQLGGNDRFSKVTFSATSGQTYYIYVTGFSANSGTFQLSLTCTNAPTLTVSPTTISQTAAAGSASISVTSNCSSWTVSGAPAWATVSPTSGSNNGTITVSFQANTSTQSRSATLTITGCSISRTVSDHAGRRGGHIRSQPHYHQSNGSGRLGQYFRDQQLQFLDGERRTCLGNGIAYVRQQQRYHHRQFSGKHLHTIAQCHPHHHGLQHFAHGDDHAGRRGGHIRSQPH